MDRVNFWSIFLILVILGIILSIFWFPLPHPPNSGVILDVPESPNVEVRAAMDIGSGATNLKVAKVDRNTDKIISYIFEESIKVPYQKHLEQSSNNTFDQEVMNQGIQAIKTLKELADKYEVKKIVAVATAAFRKANNAPQFAKEIQKQTGVQVMIIDQDEEGILAFRGALAVTPVHPQQAVVWDIGGGSMQLTTLTNEGSYLIDKGKTASIPFKNAVIQEVKKENMQQIQSPNPLNVEQMQQALQVAGKSALTTNIYIQEKIQHPETRVIAVGNLFNYGVLPLVDKEKKVIAQTELESAVYKMANKTDQELPGGSLVEVAVTNPLLVLGYMEALNINQVDVVNVNNADGALTYPAYWEE